MQNPKIDIVFDGCAGVFHSAAKPLSRGVIICPAHGYEEICTHRNWRLFADELAAAGLPTVRFDYPGTGDSLGSDQDSDRLTAWLASISAAVNWMKHNAGVTEIALIGFRLGGMLATLAAENLPEVGSLVLVAPAVSGKTYLREMKLQSRLYPVSDYSGEGLSSVGFVVTEATVKALQPVNLVNAQLPHARKILILADAIKADSPFAKALVEQGCSVTCQPFAALQSIVTDPILSLAANAPFAAALPFLLDDVKKGNAANLPVEPQILRGSMFYEQAKRFGNENALFGVLCQPVGPLKRDKTILFVNGGANHHVGWARNTVVIARRLAEAGYTSLRMDIAGLGESEMPEGKDKMLLYADESQEDVSTAVNYLESLGFGSLVVIGSCSGAQVAFHAAARETRIKSLVLLNLLRFNISPSEAGAIGGAQGFQSTANYLKSIRDPQSWKRLAYGGWSKVSGIAREYGRRAAILLKSHFGAMIHQWMGVTRFTHPIYEKFIAIAQRGTKVLIVYSESDNGLDEFAIHAGVNGGLLKRIPEIEFDLINNADHNLTSAIARDAFGARLLDFLRAA